MTMHLIKIHEKVKKETKWKSAEHKRRHEQLQKEWQNIKESHSQKVRTIKAGSIGTKYRLGPPPGRGGNSHIPSIVDTISIAPKKAVMEYTGTNMKGIGTLHKSNAVPIFTDDEMIDQANMRR